MTNTKPPSDDLMREQRLQRNLKILVAGLGVLILVGLGAVAVRIIGYSGSGGKGSSSRTVVAPPAGDAVSFELPKGAKILSISLSGDRLAVQHDGPSGPGITILDASTGRRVLDMKPVETLPRN
ncbi:hypothetical protein [Hyphomicrobium sp.]|jgi:hypothetical protein|uniref:hypothetical protein n=1 Tax=Hyphomicrobium sp. TaxID=82 RepID=UPI0035622470